MKVEDMNMGRNMKVRMKKKGADDNEDEDEGRYKE
jgi:hypothetical protein